MDVKTVGNAMMSSGASPYYESDVAIEGTRSYQSAFRTTGRRV